MGRLYKLPRPAVEEAMIESNFRAVIFQEDGWWVAQCLEFDLAVQARELSEVVRRLGRSLAAQLMVNLEAGREPFTHLPPTPARFHRLWERASATGLTIDPADAPFSRIPAEARPHLELRAA